MTTPIVVQPVADPRSRGVGVTSLAIGILLVLGVALWMLLGGLFAAALVFALPLFVVAAFVLGSVHLVAAAISLSCGVVAIAKDRGRLTGILGIVLTVLATTAAVLGGALFLQIAAATGSTPAG